MNAALPAVTVLGAAEVAAARQLAVAQRRSVVEVLEATLALPPEEFVQILASALTVRAATFAEIEHWTPDFSQVDFSEASRRHCVFASNATGEEFAVYFDPFDEAIQHWRLRHRRLAEPVLIHRDEFTAWMARIEERMTAMPHRADTVAGTMGGGKAGEELSLAQIGAATSPVIQFVNSTLYDALKAGASDVHLETDQSGLAVKFRLDGVLNKVALLSEPAMAEQVVSRIKVMAELDIAERRVPQDGRLQVSRLGRTIDVRVSVMPSIHGEDVVMRILDRQALADSLSGLSLNALGFDDASVVSIRRLARQPYGMLLVTGPTGSGKTTTLYAALTETHDPRDKTITIEDPVEYQLPNVLQIPVNEKKGLTFARGLRSILRHDPDRILVGEIRDAETAQIAVQSALTGHVVFTTVHANSVLDVFGRFIQFGIDTYSFVSALNGIMAQRLVRQVCPQCAVIDEDIRGILEESEVPPSLRATGKWVRAVGCAHCRGTGYKGRFAISEILRLNSEIRSLIAERATLLSIESAASAAGLVNLRTQALTAAASGRTTMEEVNRVTSA